jgi:anti-sigma regulatory factor (Ser/Thr protein kinase)
VSTLAIPNDVAALRDMSEWLHANLDALSVSEQLRFNLDLCANEAVANVIGYAYTDHGRHAIELRLFCDAGTLRLEIEDDGAAYDPLARPPQPRPTRLEDAQIGGLGVDLMKTLMSECRYERAGNRNILTLVARIDGEQSRG